MKSNRIIWACVSITVLITAAVSLGTFDSYGRQIVVQRLNPTPTPEIKSTRDLSKYGIVAYDASETDNQRDWERRRQINQRYDDQAWVVSTVNNPRVAGVGKITHDPPPPLFPVDESTLVVMGEVVDAKAFLSNDKGGVYTEFSIRIDDVLKNDGEKNTKTVMADREGGVVLYPNGQNVLYQSSERALPSLGSKYLFFLFKDRLSPNYRILTSYDLSGGRIIQMEIGRPFEEYKNKSKSAFIEEVREKIGRPPNQ